MSARPVGRVPICLVHSGLTGSSISCVSCVLMCIFRAGKMQSCAGDQLRHVDDQSHVMSEELDWELSDIFEGGMFAFPVYESAAARRVVRYLLRRGVLAEEIASAIEQPGSTADLVAWLAGDERKTMVGVWAMAWLNDAHRRYDEIQNAPPPPPAIPRPDDFPRGPIADRQPSVDSDFGGSGEGSRTGSRKGSFGDGLSTDYSDHVITDDDELSSAGVPGVGCRRTCYRDSDGPPSRPRSELIDPDRAGFFIVSIETSDSGNVSDACACVCALDRKSSAITSGCHCTLAHYTASADALLSDVRF